MAGFGSELARMRGVRGLTQRQLAVALGVAQPVVARWERGWYGTRVETVQAVCRALGCVAVLTVDEAGEISVRLMEPAAGQRLQQVVELVA